LGSAVLKCNAVYYVRWLETWWEVDMESLEVGLITAGMIGSLVKCVPLIVVYHSEYVNYSLIAGFQYATDGTDL
jgi:hypothetical protein